MNHTMAQAASVALRSAELLVIEVRARERWFGFWSIVVVMWILLALPMTAWRFRVHAWLLCEVVTCTLWILSKYGRQNRKVEPPGSRSKLVTGRT